MTALGGEDCVGDRVNGVCARGRETMNWRKDGQGEMSRSEVQGWFVGVPPR